MSESLADALLRALDRVQNKVMPAYLEIGPPGEFAVHMMRESIKVAQRAMVEGDCVAMIRACKDLEGYKL
jgi:hypothetical protein